MNENVSIHLETRKNGISGKFVVNHPYLDIFAYHDDNCNDVESAIRSLHILLDIWVKKANRLKQLDKDLEKYAIPTDIEEYSDDSTFFDLIEDHLYDEY